jgi:hypothetical protein
MVLVYREGHVFRPSDKYDHFNFSCGISVFVLAALPRVIRPLWQHAKILWTHHFSECAKDALKSGNELSMIVCQVMRDQSI